MNPEDALKIITGAGFDPIQRKVNKLIVRSKTQIQPNTRNYWIQHSKVPIKL